MTEGPGGTVGGGQTWAHALLETPPHPQPGPKGREGAVESVASSLYPRPGLLMFLEGLRTQVFMWNPPVFPSRQPSPSCKKIPWRDPLQCSPCG